MSNSNAKDADSLFSLYVQTLESLHLRAVVLTSVLSQPLHQNVLFSPYDSKRTGCAPRQRCQTPRRYHPVTSDGTSTWTISPPELIASATSWPSYVVLACRPGTCFSSTPLSCGRQWSTLPLSGTLASQPSSATSWRPSIQRSSLRTTFSDLSYRQALFHTRLPTLRDTRVNLCRTCAASSLANADLAHCFPSRRSDCHSYNLRNNHSSERAPPYNKTTREQPSEL